MPVISDPARAAILSSVRSALGRGEDGSVPPVPASVRMPDRIPGTVDAEIGLLCEEIGKLGGHARRLTVADLGQVLDELICDEAIKKVTLWQTAEIKALGLAELLSERGVEIVSPYAGKGALAGCDLGVTGADMALPETGTLLLRSSAKRPRSTSLLPRVHLALVMPSAMRADLDEALAEAQDEGHFVLITGPSRTADIELTVTIGVHGPRALYVWVLER